MSGRPYSTTRFQYRRQYAPTDGRVPTVGISGAWQCHLDPRAAQSTAAGTAASTKRAVSAAGRMGHGIKRGPDAVVMAVMRGDARSNHWLWAIDGHGRKRLVRSPSARGFYIAPSFLVLMLASSH